jgi:polar amino acid transport system ATP-binding protein/sulfate transport system ATP-binding protein
VLVGEAQKPVERGRVGVVAQHYPLFNHRTVMGNLLVAGRRAGLSGDAAEQKARGLLKGFGMEEHGRKWPAQLSGGQRQRIAIAQQFMCSDNFLLMDEPFSGLDPLAIDRVADFINGVAHAHELNTIIVVTHDITAAMEVSDTIWLMAATAAKGEPIRAHGSGDPQPHRLRARVPQGHHRGSGSCASRTRSASGSNVVSLRLAT